ncbi:MAG: 50S ribosomal protein L1 [Kiritimatiellae bacterium]|nr:50S ribosomal protein L1 [Kiritimatiellia bacterium]
MSKHGKKYRAIAKAAPKAPVSINEAVAFIKAHPGSKKFDETLDVYMRLGVDFRKTDTPVRGTVKLPAGSGKKIKVAVFAGGEHADQAREAGADFVGLDDLIEKVTKESWTDFDVAIATTEAMKSVRKCARVLGPRGLMPNPKTGTVTDDPATAVKEAKAGKVDFRMDKTGNVSVIAGKLSFEADKLVANVKAVVEAIQSARPATVKGAFIRSLTLSSTMGVGVPCVLAADGE